MADIIHHLASAAEFVAASSDQPYLPPSFADDGFIHCTREATVLLEVANRFYADQPGEFVVLDIDTARLSAPVRWEAPVPPASDGTLWAGALFPHIYGSINRDAIVAVRPAHRSAEGRFLSV